MLEVLVEHVDPTRTLLYVPDWREAGYDRDYPTYDAPRPGVKAFIDRAHALGFRVMLHVNYFGCDPLHPVYATFAPYHIRSPWGAHDREWWLWERADPVIKFAYINPAYKPWRDLFVSRMVELHALLNPDAYHLDQTLVIYNDHNGLINGMSMIDGNIALHRELREALPQVALSGEGLNEVAYRYEAFAQRHASGIDHTTGTHDIGQLRTAHPIAAYLMLPYTANYGYLGFAPPWNGQLYSAWNEAYAHWGVLPTLAYAPQDLAERPGFTRQLLDEIAFFQTEALAPDLDGPWPEEVVFPYRTADGTRAVRTAGRVLRAGEREIARTITGVTHIALPGTIPGWVGYNREALIGLDPTLRYPYFDQPRAYDKLHVALLPEGFTVDGWALHDGLAFARLGRTAHGDIRFGELLYDAKTGTRLLKGGGISARGELNGADGGRFTGSGDILSAHPPYLTGTGETFARFDVTLPDDAARFVGEPAIGMGAVGKDKSDGATFSVTVRADGQEARAELHHATEERGRLELDVSAFAGRRAEVELAVGPGPDNDPSFDWAQWHRPRIERGGAIPGAMRLRAPGAWTLALHGRGASPLPSGAEMVTAEGLWPGACYLLAETPEPAGLPLALHERAFVTTYLDEQGAPWPNAPYGAAGAQTVAIAGTERTGLSAHPPANGRTIMDFPMALPNTPARFAAHVTLRDEAKSNGVIFRVEANGVRLAEARVRPDEPADLAADLSPWVGAPVVLSLITDANGDADYDWAFWCEPVLTTAE